MIIAITGVLAGFVHVLSGPDHLAAIAPLALTERRRGWIAGSAWGLGHASGVVVVAAIAVLLRDLLPPIDVISAWSERLVGGVLICVGLWAFRRSAQIRPGPHSHGTLSHGHMHVQSGPGWLRRVGHAHAAFYVGILHGIAGSSHFFGVLPALALPTRAAALSYVGSFGVGTVAAMTVFAAALGCAGHRWHHAVVPQRAMMMTAAALAIAVGGVWLIG